PQSKPTDASRNNEIEILKSQVAALQVELNALKKVVAEQRSLKVLQAGSATSDVNLLFSHARRVSG
ncbi:MAG: hypothetical protein ACREMD_08975, partial [Gemmatimonadota bacterium]